MNISSLPKHSGELVHFLNTLQTQFQVIIICETGSKNLSTVENIFPNHNFLSVPPNSLKKGGVGIYISKDIDNFEIITDVKLNKECHCTLCDYESISINFDICGQLYTILAAYRHPRGNISHFIESLRSALQKCDSKRTIILAGDENINLLNYQIKNVSDYLNMLLSEKFLPYITLPTRITDHSATCIDHIFVRHPSKQMHIKANAGIFFCDISDHLACFISFRLNPAHKSKTRPQIRLYGERNCQNFKHLMESYSWDDLFQNSNDWYCDFIKNLKSFFESSFPTVTLSRKRSHDKPWVTKGLKISISKKHRLYKKKLMKPSQNNENNYKRYNLILRKCLYLAEKNYYDKLFEDKKNYAINTWKTLGPIINPKKYKKQLSVPKIKDGGRLITDKNKISEHLNRYFCNIGENLKQNIPYRNNEFVQYLPESPDNFFYLTPVSQNEVLKSQP